MLAILVGLVMITSTAAFNPATTPVSPKIKPPHQLRESMRGAEEFESTVPRSILPITVGVFSQMLGEGISLSSLPLHLTSLGAPPVKVGLAISCFSVAQMTVAPILVRLSTIHGRSKILRICLIGAALSSLLISTSTTVTGGELSERVLSFVDVHCQYLHTSRSLLPVPPSFPTPPHISPFPTCASLIASLLGSNTWPNLSRHIRRLRPRRSIHSDRHSTPLPIVLRPLPRGRVGPARRGGRSCLICVLPVIVFEVRHSQGGESRGWRGSE